MKINMLHICESEFATIQNIPAAARIQTALRETRCRCPAPPPRVGGSRTLISTRGDRQRANGDQDCSARETDIAQGEFSQLNIHWASHVDDFDGIFGSSFAHQTLTYRKNITPPRVSAGRGPRRPSRRSAGGLTLRRYGRSISQSVTSYGPRESLNR
jgi:hypothetical protein